MAIGLEVKKKGGSRVCFGYKKTFAKIHRKKGLSLTDWHSAVTRLLEGLSKHKMSFMNQNPFILDSRLRLQYCGLHALYTNKPNPAVRV